MQKFCSAELLYEKYKAIQSLQYQLKTQTYKTEILQNNLRKLTDFHKSKSLSRIRQLEKESQELKRVVNKKQLLIVEKEDQLNQKVMRQRENYLISKKNLLGGSQSNINGRQSKNQEKQLLELKSLAKRQSIVINFQKGKYADVVKANEGLNQQIEELREAVQRKKQEISIYQSKVRQLNEQMEKMKSRLEKQDQANETKGEFEKVRKRIKEMQKGEINKIQLIVNKLI